MSLILYDGDISLSQTNKEIIPIKTHELKDDHNVILNNNVTMVIHNQQTDEFSIVDTRYHERSIVCPHCGSLLKNSDGGGGPGGPRDEGPKEFNINDQFIHSNYFKLLENNINKSTTNHLSDSIFTQGYFNKFFKTLKLLGRGSRGSVYKVEHYLNDLPLGIFAMKKITIGDDNEWLMKVLNEVHMLIRISSKNMNLINYNHVWIEIDSINEFGPKVPCAFVLQQYCSGGNLEEFINDLQTPELSVKDMKLYHLKRVQGRLLTNEEILILFMGIVNGVEALHKNHIIHRDLKPSNCLLNKPYLLKFPDLKPNISILPNVLIGDFGESQIEGSLRSKSGYTGTLEYSAPELINEMGEFNKKTDVYSLGMILYFMCFGRLPYDHDVVEKNQIGVFQIDDRDGLHHLFVELIKNLTDRDANRRMECFEILDHLQRISKELKRSEDVPIKRLSISDDGNRERPWFKYSQIALQLVLMGYIIKYTDINEFVKFTIVFLNGLSLNNISIYHNTLLIIMISIILYTLTITFLSQ